MGTGFRSSRVRAIAHLWMCTHPVVGEQLLLLVSDQFGNDHIMVKRSGYCLDGGLVGFTNVMVTQRPCDWNSRLQSRRLYSTGEIANVANPAASTPSPRAPRAGGSSSPPATPHHLSALVLLGTAGSS